MTARLIRTTLFAGVVAALLAASAANAADGDKSKIKGLITGIDGSTLTVKDDNNVERKVTLSSTTTYKRTKGLTGVISEKAEQDALIPGLPISAEVVAEGSGFNATGISFKSEDFRTAQQVQAGLAPTEARMNDFGSYEALATVDVLFASGSVAISQTGKSELMAFAAKAKETKAYQVVLQGFTDATGDPAANQRLSASRANAVANFLQQQGGLAPGRVRTGDGMGVAADAGTGSNANARKVVVKLVVDKGVQEGN